jgi:pimeloyl-ACP methyl ester carboxylesterase
MLLKKQMLTDDGLTLTAFHTPLQSDATIVFLNDFGVDSRIVRSLAERAVGHGVNLVTWDTRGVPGAFGPDFRDYGVDRHARDWLVVMGRLKLDRVALVGWCGSCQLGLELARRHPSRVAGLALVSGYFGLPEALSRDAGRMMIEMAEAISATETKAKFFHKVLATSSQNVATSCACESASYKALTEGFKSNPEALLRWAVMQRQLVGADIEAMCSGVGCPVWVIAGGADEMIAPVDVEPVAQRIPQAKLTVFAQADHYALFGDEAVQSAILARARSWCDAGGEVAEPRLVQGAVSLGA